MKDVVGLGALNVDLVYEIKRPHLDGFMADKIERGGEFVCTEKDYQSFSEFIRRVGRFVWQSGGGQAANTCYALARWGFSVGFVGKVGRDEFGRFLKKSLEGVDTSGITTDRASGVSLILLDQEGERTIFVFPNANDHLDLKEVDLNYFSDTHFVYYSSFAGKKSFEVQKALAQLLPSKVKLSLDLGEIYARKGLKELKPLLKRAQVVFGTEKEISILAQRELDGALEELVSLGVEVVAVKKGADGARLFTKYEDLFLSAPRVDAVDTTGAGDVFAAGFLAGLLKGLDFKRAGSLANLLAAQSVTGYARSAYPDSAFFEKTLREVAE